MSARTTDRIQKLLLRRLERLLNTLQAAGGEVALVGGAVRDSFLGHVASDLDVATSLPPTTVLSHLPDARPTGLAFGTVTVTGESFVCHITTYRADGAYGDRRHPDAVTFGVSLADDLARRDFTVNAIALLADGTVVDPFGGRTDIGRRRLKAVGDPTARLGEDPLRIIRAVRFLATLGFEPDGDLASAMRERAADLTAVHPERLWPEVTRTLAGNHVDMALAAFPRVMEKVLPLSVAPVVDLPRDPALRIARLCREAKPAALAARLVAMGAGKQTAERTARLVKLAASPPADDVYALRRAVTMIGEKDLDDLALLADSTFASAKVLAHREPGLRHLAVSGSDIVEAAGRPAGSWVGDAISHLWEGIWRERTPNTSDALRREIAAQFSPKGPDRER